MIANPTVSTIDEFRQIDFGFLPLGNDGNLHMTYWYLKDVLLGHDNEFLAKLPQDGGPEPHTNPRSHAGRNIATLPRRVLHMRYRELRRLYRRQLDPLHELGDIHEPDLELVDSVHFVVREDDHGRVAAEGALAGLRGFEGGLHQMLGTCCGGISDIFVRFCV